MKGHRKFPDATGYLSLSEGEYGQARLGTWFACAPGGYMANLSRHDVTEHSDGTITVKPSIRISDPVSGEEHWHGYLERGVWRTV